MLTPAGNSADGGDKVGGEADFDEAFGDVGVPDAVASPDPAAGIFGGWGFLVGVEAGEIHAPNVGFAGREVDPSISELIRGYRWVTNDTVNALATLAGATIGQLVGLQ